MVSRRTERRGSVSRDPRGQVGIGTLIVFIAMVLVAAIAGGVLLDTAGLLQSQAEDTGQSSSEQVSDRIQIFGTVGILDGGESASGGDEGELDEDNVVVADRDLTAVVTGEEINEDDELDVEADVVTEDGRNVVVDGTDVVTEDGENVQGENGDNIIEDDGNVRTANGYAVDRDGDNIVTFEGAGDQINAETEGGVNVIPDDDAFENSGESSGGDSSGSSEHGVQRLEVTVGTGPGSGPVDLDDVTIQYLGPGGATNLVSNDTEDADGPTFEVERIRGENTDNVLVDHGDQSKIVIDLVDSDDALEPLTGGEEVQLTLVTGSGATTTVQFTVPSTIPDDGAIRL